MSKLYNTATYKALMRKISLYKVRYLTNRGKELKLRCSFLTDRAKQI